MKGGIYMTIFIEKNKKKAFKNRKMFCRLVFVLISGFFIEFVLGNIGNEFWIDTIRAEESLSMYSGSYALTDARNNRVLKGKEADSPMSNASTTKILTCIVTLENCGLEEVVTISEKAANQPRVRLGMREGEQYPLKDMLYGLMLESYNDCAVAIAEHVAGSTEAFAKMMNDKARKIGCMDTYFITPNGLDAEDGTSYHHTTARDLCRMMAYCTWESSQSQTFLKITQTRNFTGNANGKNYSFVNHNAFLNQMEGVLTGKTGFTNKAGYCYVAALERNGERYCIALLACGWPNNKNYKWQDARTLFEYGIETYDIKTVKVKAINTQLEIEGCTNKSNFKDINKTQDLQLYAKEEEYKVLLAENETLDAEVVYKKNLQLPVKKEQKIGVCRIYLGDILLDEFEILTQDSVSSWDLPRIWREIVYQFFTFS